MSLSLEAIAGLGARRAPGESLTSWLAAGPLGSSVLSRYAEHIAGSLSDVALATNRYCPACKLRERDSVRWYSREDWIDPRYVVCTVHAEPLLHADRPPLRLRGQPTSRHLRIQLKGLAHWTTAWRQKSPCRPGGRLSRRLACQENLVLWALTRQAHAGVTDAHALGQWQLWLDGWPVPAAPRCPIRYQLRQVVRQVDRLAIVVLVWRACQTLSGEQSMWPALPLTDEVYWRLRMALERAGSGLAHRLEQVFTPVA